MYHSFKAKTLESASEAPPTIDDRELVIATQSPSSSSSTAASRLFSFLQSLSSLLHSLQQRIASHTRPQQVTSPTSSSTSQMTTTTTETPCDSASPCMNGGSCISSNGGFILSRNFCICPGGTTGTRCEQKIDWCNPQPCMNDGLCINIISNYVCQCLPNYSGTQCEISLNWTSDQGIIEQKDVWSGGTENAV